MTADVHPHVRPVEEQRDEPVNIHMPNPSYFPLLLSLGLFIAALGLLFDGPVLTIGLLHLPVATALGGLLAFVATYAWAFEPAD